MTESAKRTLMTCLGLLVPPVLAVIMLAGGLWDEDRAVRVYYLLSLVGIVGYYWHPKRVLWAPPAGYAFCTFFFCIIMGGIFGLAFAMVLAVPQLIVTSIISLSMRF